MKTIFLISTIVAFYPLFSQSYSSSVFTKFKIESEVLAKSHEISISDSKIIINNFIAGKEPLILNIDSTQVKFFYNAYKDCKWYYCSTNSQSTEIKSQKYIAVIIEGYSKSISLYKVLDEVTNIEYNFSLK